MTKSKYLRGRRESALNKDKSELNINVGGFSAENSPHFAQGQFDQSRPGCSYLNTFHLKFSISIHFKGKLRATFHYFCFFCDQKPFMLSRLKEEKTLKEG